MKRVVICVSARFSNEMASWVKRLAELGVQADAPEQQLSTAEFDGLTEADQRRVRLELAEAHHALIDRADLVFVYNPNGYIGNSVTLEIGYALGKSKPVYALEPDAEQGRDVLFAGYCSGVDELARQIT